MSTEALERVLRRAGINRAPTEVCDLCAGVLPEPHRHLLDTEHGDLCCACQACCLLFAAHAGSDDQHRHYRLVPDKRMRLGAVPTAALGVPVGLAFFVRHADGAVIAHYPSPIGATQWEVDADAWRDVVESCDPLEHLQPDVEALLVNTARGADEHWLVPIDDCYRLIALVRHEWRGWTGGSQVWPLIQDFFAQLDTRPHGRSPGRG
jgi:hypothetical protein